MTGKGDILRGVTTPDWLLTVPFATHFLFLSCIYWIGFVGFVFICCFVLFCVFDVVLILFGWAYVIF